MSLGQLPNPSAQASQAAQAVEQPQVVTVVKPDGKKLAEEKKREEYRKKMADIEKLQMENLQTMYPEYYQQQQQQEEQEILEEDAEGASAV